MAKLNQQSKAKNNKSANQIPEEQNLSENALGGNAYEQIRWAISSGKLKPGDRVTENNLANWLSVSRTPVREAIFRLEAERLLERNRNGLAVRKLSYQEITELYDMREVLEGTAARLAAIHASDVEVTALNRILEKEKQSAKQDSQNAASLNKQFHTVVYHAGHNRYLLQSLMSLENAMILLGRSTLQLPARHAEAISEHENIISCIESKNTDAADKAARHHIKQAKLHRLKIVLEELHHQ